MKRTIDALIEESRDAMIMDIRRLVGIESINGKTEACRAALEQLLCRAQALGMHTGRTREGDAGFVETGSGSKTLGMLVHMDVVDVGDAAKWRFPPFSGTLADGFIWGRGTVDDKGAAVMCLYAMYALVQAGCELKSRIRLIIGTNEEGDWTDMEHYIEEFGKPDYGFSPDGDFPICNAEKGYADVLLTFMEPNAGLIASLCAGDSPNSIPSKAALTWTDGTREEFHGKSAHSSEPNEGNNAILRLAGALAGRGHTFNFVRFLNDFASDEDLCPALRIDDGSDYIGRDRVGRTTACPTVLSAVGGEVRLNLNIRQKFGVDREDILTAVNGYCAQYGFTAHMLPGYLPGTMVSTATEPLRIMKEVYEEYGYKAEFVASAGTSYAKAMPNFVSWGPVFRTDPNCFHSENERLSLNTLIVASKMYARYLYRMTALCEAESARSTSLEKALSLIEHFMQQPYSFNLSEIVAMSGMNRTTVYRDLSVFEDAGVLIRDPHTKKYSMGPKAFRMGTVYLRSSNYEESLLVLLERIAEEVKESVGLARRDGNSVISIYSVESHQPIKMNDLPGEYYPMNKGTYGKCLMAYHDRETVKKLLRGQRFEKTGPNTLTRTEDILNEYANIRKNGFVLSLEETAPLIIGVGVPLCDSSGGIRNVVSVSFLKHDDYLARIETIKAVLFRYKPLIEACL